MRLVYLNADRGIPLLGSKGASVHVRASVRAFAQYAECVTVLSSRIRPKSGPVANANGVEARVLGPFGSGGGPVDALRANDQIGAALDELCALGDLGVLYERLSLWSVGGAEAARRLGVPWFLEVNAPLAEEASRYRDLEGRELAFYLQRTLLNGATGVVVVSNALRQWAQSLGVEPERVLVAPNGCDPGPPTASRRPAGGRPFTITFVGSLKPWHGLDTLVEAFLAFWQRSPNSRLVIVGDGPLLETARRELSAALPETAFRLTGAVPHDEVATLLQDADVAVAPYPQLRDFYFSPLKIVEYCAAGVPVIASRIGQIEETMSHGRNAFLVPPGNTAALAEALTLLCEDEELRARLRRGACEFARTRSWSAVTERVVRWMEARIVASRGRALAGAQP